MQCSSPGDSYAFLKSFVQQLIALQKQNMWKVTLAQKTIGGPQPTTAAALHTAGQLSDDLLETLIREFTHVIRNLQLLTLPEETDIVNTVRQELCDLPADARAADVSATADAFVGFAVKKNFHHKKGRFKRLRDMGETFRKGTLLLTDEEKVPARHLGVLLQAGALMEDVFADGPTGPSALDTVTDTWRGLLEHAVGLRGPVALARVWTCGLADSGLHNLFLDPDTLWLFDMGEPALCPLPAFLTKFLMSFFHTLGMECDGAGGWVNRFTPGDRLRLTEQTAAILPKVYNAFQVRRETNPAPDVVSKELICKGLPLGAQDPPPPTPSVPVSRGFAQQGAPTTPTPTQAPRPTQVSGGGAHCDSRGFWFKSSISTPRRAGAQWPTAGAP